jgi:hypothetical protein
MGLMKLISTDEELKKLSMQHNDVNMTGKVQINIDQTDAKLGE